MSDSTSTVTTTVFTTATAIPSPAPANPVNLVNLAITLAGGELFSGFVFVLTLQMLYQYGAQIGIRNDKKRQILLNIICFVCSINTMISYGFNATKASVLVSNITTIITFMSVQYGLVILNHNTIIRFSTMLRNVIPHSRDKIDRLCMVLYFLPWLAFIPIYYAIDEKWIKGGLTAAFNTSSYNSLYYKPLNIALIVGTEVLAIVTDVLLLKQVAQSKQQLQSLAGAATKTSKNILTNQSTSSPSYQMSMDIMMNYGATWFIIVVDVIVKYLISINMPFLFDSIISITAIAMRSRANLIFGLELQNIISGGSRTGIEMKKGVTNAGAGYTNNHQKSVHEGIGQIPIGSRRQSTQNDFKTDMEMP